MLFKRFPVTTMLVVLISLFVLSPRVPAADGDVAPGVPPDAGDVVPVEDANNWKPEGFEPALKANPADEEKRELALRYYSGRARDFAKLKQHTLAMIEYHPDNKYILFMNGAAFYADSAYRLEVIDQLEQRLMKPLAVDVQHGVYWNLSMIARQGAMPPPVDESGRQRFLAYYELPAGTTLPAEINQELADKAIKYFRLALETTARDAFKIGFTSKSFAELLRSLNRNDEALEVVDAALPHSNKVSDPDLLVTYGRCLKTAGQVTAAKKAFRRVRTIDDEWGDGPGQATMEAETELGLIALEQGDPAKAGKYLLSSLRVQRTTNIWGKNYLPIGYELAEKLLKAGQRKAVVEYCRATEVPATADLLQRALRVG